MVLFVVRDACVGVAIFANLLDFQSIGVFHRWTNGRGVAGNADRGVNGALGHPGVEYARSAGGIGESIDRFTASRGTRRGQS